MEKKKSNNKKAIGEKSTMIKIAEKIGQVAGTIMYEKDHLIKIAGNAIDSVKEAIHDMTAKKEPKAKEAVKKAVLPAAKKIKKTVAVKKVPAVKKPIKKAVKKAAKSNPAKKK
jgi:hypothetical protein